MSKVKLLLDVVNDIRHLADSLECVANSIVENTLPKLCTSSACNAASYIFVTNLNCRNFNTILMKYLFHFAHSNSGISIQPRTSINNQHFTHYLHLSLIHI